jgi:lipoprotein-releasing system permease protein
VLRALDLVLDVALAHLRKRKRQTAVSIVGVSLGVGFFIAVAALMQGFQQYFIQQTIDVSPHIVMKDEFRAAPLQPAARLYAGGAVRIVGMRPLDEPRGIRNDDVTVAAIRRLPGIAVAPSLHGQIVLRYGAKDVAATLIGINPSEERRVSNIERDLVRGKLSDLEAVANGIILGEGLASKLGAWIGDSVNAVSPTGALLKTKIVGLFQTGLTTLDNSVAYILLKKAQVLQGRPNVVNQIRIRLDDVTRAEAVAARIEARFGYRTEAWQETNRNVFGIFVIQNAIMYSTTGAILVVAAFGIFNIIATVVLEKTRDIAILKSIGLDEGDIRAIFLAEGLALGLVGAVLGWAVGYGLTELLAQVRFDVEGFVKTRGFVLSYTFTHYAIAGGAASAAAALAAFLPARKAAALNPVDIIRGAT